MPAIALFTFLGVQWWAAWYPGAEPGGGSYIAQRMLASKSERDSLGAVLFFKDLTHVEHKEEQERLKDRLAALGITGTLPLRPIRPSLRVYAIHQHEEGLVSVAGAAERDLRHRNTAPLGHGVFGHLVDVELHGAQ